MPKKLNRAPMSSRLLRRAALAAALACVTVAVALMVWPSALGKGPAAEPVSNDWPMWRYDAARSADYPGRLPEKLGLQWVRQLPPPAPAWRPEQYKLQFDRSYEPVVMGRQIFVGSMASDKVTAYDTRTGRENWHFYCDGPVRFAPIASQDKVYFVSDDGNLYCLGAGRGKLLWKRRLAPDDRRLLGNGRLISAWCARGGPVLRDGTIYCTAGIWPFMGVFVYAIDAETGRVIWENSDTGAIYIKQQHSSPAFGGMSPQGYLAATEEKLLVTSRTIPACFDTHTGKLLYYHLSDRSYGKYVGGYAAFAWKQWFVNNKVAYRLADGLALGTIAAQVMAADAVVGAEKEGTVAAYTLAEAQIRDPKSKKVTTRLKASPLWKIETEPALDRVHFKAGQRLYTSGRDGTVAALEIPRDNHEGRLVWRAEVQGTVWNMLAGDERVFVVTEEGRLYCFGAPKASPVHHEDKERPLRPARPADRVRAAQILEQSRDAKGYCLWLGARNGRLLREVLRQSALRIIVVEPDPRNVAALREALDRAGLYGPRVCVLPGDLGSVPVPPYLASLLVVEDLLGAGLDGTQDSIERLYHLLRPYSGLAWVAADAPQRVTLCKHLANANLSGARVSEMAGALAIERTGPVPGAGDWTHQYGDVANTACSQDQLKLPLGILWFGEESSFGDVLPRHAHGPPEQVVHGRLFIEGIDSLSARDVYTGRTLWKRTLKGLGNFDVYYNASYKHDFRDLSYNQEHIPGANARGTNFVATAERVYVIQETECHVLSAATGETEKVLTLPREKGDPQENWGYIGIYRDYLIAGAGFVPHSSRLDRDGKNAVKWASLFDKIASRRLVVMNRHTGQSLWTREARHGFLHNGIVAGDGTIFCLDAPPPQVRKSDEEAGRYGSATAELLALDVHTGRTVWSDSDRAFGSWLAYSEPFGILLQAHRKSRDMLWEPGNRMATFRARTGELLWDKQIDHTGPCMLREGMIITQESAYSLLTGRQRTYEHPLTAEQVPWRYSRNYGCGTGVASRNLLTFRSAAAGYFDLTTDAGTGNFGGFRSGCTSNLVVADGVLNAPDYTQTCTCSYQNQTSLAMIHMPDVEMWTFSDPGDGNGPVERVGINFGAPGDRKADNGTLWLEHPGVGGSSPELDVTLTPENPPWFRRHSLRLKQGNLKWVEASGLRGVRSIGIRVCGLPGEKRRKASDARPTAGPGDERSFAVNLHFVEPDDKKPGQRVFDVAIEGITVLKDFDIAAEARSSHVGIVKKFAGLRAAEFITITLTPVAPETETIICGIEIRAENTK
ncbi:MAG: PQQ-binding-like beta-propeller repeat protein [Sedimentisphaerales bacterium]|nr:PQQ-binding-like beta-propeller repeat protein [Sedimentisphaerales bacterium]